MQGQSMAADLQTLLCTAALRITLVKWQVTKDRAAVPHRATPRMGPWQQSTPLRSPIQSTSYTRMLSDSRPWLPSEPLLQAAPVREPWHQKARSPVLGLPCCCELETGSMWPTSALGESRTGEDHARFQTCQQWGAASLLALLMKCEISGDAAL